MRASHRATEAAAVGEEQGWGHGEDAGVGGQAYSGGTGRNVGDDDDDERARA